MKRALKLLTIAYLIVALAAGTYIYVSDNGVDMTSVAETESKQEPEIAEEESAEEESAEGESVEEEAVEEEAVEEESAEMETAEEEAITVRTPEEIVAGEDPTAIVEDADNPHYYLFVVNQSAVNIRSGIGKEHPAKFSLTKGQMGYVIGAGQYWSIIASEKGWGYVCNDYITCYEVSRSEVPETYLAYLDEIE